MHVARRAEGRNVGMDSYCHVIGCESNGVPPFDEMSVRRLDAVGVAANRFHSQKKGHEIAEQVKIGDLIAAQNTGHEDYDDQYWVGVVLDSGNGKPILKCVEVHLACMCEHFQLSMQWMFSCRLVRKPSMELGSTGTTMLW